MHCKERNKDELPLKYICLFFKASLTIRQTTTEIIEKSGTSDKIQWDFQISKVGSLYFLDLKVDGSPGSLININIVFSETTWPIESKFHMTTPYDWLAKIYTNCYDHMTKMASTPIYGKKLFKYLLLWNQKAVGFGTWYVALGMWALPGLHK